MEGPGRDRPRRPRGDPLSGTGEPEEPSREGWVPEIGPGLTLEAVVEEAFDYRGNTTVVRRDGTEIVGYVFNRNATAPEPFIQLFDEAGNGPLTVRYADIANIKFTGRDTAAGKSWKAWVARKEREKEERAPAAGGSRGGDHPHPDRG
ncbi:MAG: hypothetical protein L0027_14935 [Candidatus Rokubacteria bacterium]|nr:hypothetical protein [Candidatus Rokubacteria bacterium]